MTFTYDLSSGSFTDLTRVRFHIDDIDSSVPKFTDEEINVVLDETSDYKITVIWLLQTLIVRLSSDPDFQADWLKINKASAIAGLQAMIAAKRKELGINSIITSTLIIPVRADKGEFVEDESDSADEYES